MIRTRHPGWALASLLATLVAGGSGYAAAAETDGVDQAEQRTDLRSYSARLLATYVFLPNGSGVVISADGMVLTNNHVIGDNDTVTIRFITGSTASAHLLGRDPVGDIALLRISDAHDLPHADLAPASALHPGGAVVAIGNPFGLGNVDDVPTLSQGVLSTARIVRGNYTDAVQGDAPINPGNSGGPLFDLHGRLLGINGQIRTVSGFRVNSGIGLAIASTQLAAFLPVLALADGGVVHHTCLPAKVVLREDQDEVTVIDPGTTTLAVGDQLLRVADRPATSLATALGLFSSLPFTPGATIPVSLLRNGSVCDVMITAERQPIPGLPYHGLSVDNQDGHVVVDSIDSDSPASAAQLQLGEVLRSVNGHALTTTLDWLRALEKLEIGDVLELSVQGKDGATRVVRITMREQ